MAIAQDNYRNLKLGIVAALLCLSGAASAAEDANSDTTPPAIYDSAARSVSDTEVLLTWSTNEPADGLIEYGLTTAFELGSISNPDFENTHSIQVGNLQPDNIYYFRIATSDQSSNVAHSQTFVVETSTLPAINVWYGDTQTFGAIGQPQWAINILGNAFDSDGIASLTYSLNGQPEQPLNMGPDGKRLWATGDFNVEIDFSQLNVGSNNVLLKAVDYTGSQRTRNVSINFPGNSSWPVDYTADWSAANTIADAAQVVDGKWALENNGVRTIELGYDRIIAIGDISWQSYEAVAQLTVHGLDPVCEQIYCAGGAPLIGLLARWAGHYYWGSTPNVGWFPMGAFAAVKFHDFYGPQLEMYRGSDGNIDSVNRNIDLPIGVPYVFKLRAETTDAAQRYRMKIWPAGQAEPQSWQATLDEALSATSTGSLLLIAHHVDVSFGDVVVTSLTGSPPADTTPPVISNIQVSGIGETTATVSWQTNEAADSTVAYGETPGYEAGSTGSAALVTSHSVTLSNLSPGTLYHYQARSTDESGNPASSADLTFTTSEPADTTPPVISNIQVSVIGETTATVSWQTNEAADSTVAYGETPGYEAGSTGSAALVTSHSVTLSNLSPGTLYHYQARSTDESGNPASSADLTFTTSEPADTTPPVISNIQVSGIGETTATVSWQTNEAADSTVAYGETPGYEAGSTGSAALVTSHSVTLSNLSPGTLYHYQVRSTDESGNPASSADLTFTTNEASGDTTPPVIIKLRVTGVSETSATVSWWTNEAADSAVAYGETPGYEYGSVTDALLVRYHRITLSNLSPGTQYHYQARSADESGNLASSADLTFTTSGTPADTTPPVISNIQVSGIGETNATVSWQTNEAADSTVAYGETPGYEAGSTGSAALVTSHSVTLSNLSPGTLYHYRVTSADESGNPASSADLTFTTSEPADTTPPVISNIQVSGIGETTATVSWQTNEAADSTVAYGETPGYEAGSTGSAALVTSHSVTLSNLSPGTLYHYQVRSTDESGNPASSADLTFTTSEPADTTPPVISNIQVSGIGETTATVSWQTNEAADSTVAYGETPGYEAGSTGSAALVTSHSVTLSNLSPGTLYHYQARSTDESGNPASSADLTFTTSEPADTTPPVISNIQVSGIGETSATVSWQTNEAADSTVAYGETPGYEAGSTGSAALVTSHSVTLSNLSPGTLYHYQARSTDESGNPASSADLTFTTSEPADTTPPVISNIQVSGIGETTATVSWQTNEAADSTVAYGETPGYEAGSTGSAALVTSHSVTLSNLSPGTLYHYRVTSADESGNPASSANLTFTTTTASDDTRPPKIGNIWISAISETSATVNWVTNEAASSVVTYGPSAGYENGSVGNATLVTSHSVTLSNLSPGTLYHYRVTSADESGNVANSADRTFATSGTPADTTPPVISNIQVSGIGETTATVSWQTNEAADSTVAYGETPGYEAGSTGSAALVTSHSVTLSNLSPGTLYHYQARSTDESGNPASSADLTFTTSEPADSTPPVISNIQVSGIGETSATVSWQTNEAADSTVAYGETPGYEAGSTGSAALVSSHSVTLTNLSPGTLYHYQVRSTDESGNPASSGDLTFTTSAPPADTTPPVISNIQVSGIGETSATVSWQTNEAADSTVVYGETPGYEAGSTGSAALVTSHSVTLSSLSPGTQYHYQVRSADESGNPASSGDLTFTTDTPMPPTGIASDDFSGALDTNRWSVNDPLGDAVITTTGSQLSISVPAGTPHDLWAGANHAPRVMQSITDSDFEIEVKFDSAINAQYQMQGIVIEQDDSNRVRFDFYSTNGSRWLFAASFSNGSPSVRSNIPVAVGTPMYMRISRAGSQWTQSYSTDGVNWTEVATFSHSLQATRAGLFAGNFSDNGNTPAHTALFDYFYVLP